MNNFIVTILGVVLTLSLSTCANNVPVKDNPQKQTLGQISGNNSLQTPNPFVYCKTIADAEKIAGFKITVPVKMPEGYSQSSIQAIENDMLQIFYKNGDNEILIRKGVGSEDISGDYNTYKENNTLTVGKLKVTTRGNDGKVNVATWTDGKYAFSISVNPDKIGVDNSIISDMVGSIQ